MYIIVIYWFNTIKMRTSILSLLVISIILTSCWNNNTTNPTKHDLNTHTWSNIISNVSNIGTKKIPTINGIPMVWTWRLNVDNTKLPDNIKEYLKYNKITKIDTASGKLYSKDPNVQSILDTQLNSTNQRTAIISPWEIVSFDGSMKINSYGNSPLQEEIREYTLLSNIISCMKNPQWIIKNDIVDSLIQTCNIQVGMKYLWNLFSKENNVEQNLEWMINDPTKQLEYLNTTNQKIKQLTDDYNSKASMYIWKSILDINIPQSWTK